MLITISGTPGTGKTTISKILARRLKAHIVITSHLIKKYKISTSFDRKRKTRTIDIKKLASAAQKESKIYKISVFEGHLSHFARSDVSVILRTNPRELERRLLKKGWNREKIRENVESEAMSIISGEAKNSFEIDTTKKSPKATVRIIEKLLNSYAQRKKYQKKIDWTKEYLNYLVKSKKGR